MSFSADVGKFTVKSMQAADKTRRGIITELFSSVIRDTPVDTGRARGNWQASLNAPINEPIDRIDPDGEQAIGEVLNNVGKFGETCYLTNNLPYIERLEDGYSTQAPAGMMKKNVARISQLINKQIRNNKL